MATRQEEERRRTPASAPVEPARREDGGSRPEGPEADERRPRRAGDASARGDRMPMGADEPGAGL